MGHKYSHNYSSSPTTTFEQYQQQQQQANSSPNSARFHSNYSSPRTNQTCNSGLDTCQTCKDTNTTCLKGKQERRFNQLLMLCQAFEEQYPEVWKQFVIQYYLTANFKFPQKRARKMSSSHDSAPGKLVSSSLDSQNVIYSNTTLNDSFKVSSLPSDSGSSSNQMPTIITNFHVHHSYSLGSLNENPNSNIMVNSNDAMITDKVVHLPESVRNQIEKIDRRMCSSSQDFDLSSDEDMFPNVDIANNIACEGGDRNPQYGQVMDQFMREFIDYNLKHWKIPNKLEDVNMVKIFEDFLKNINK